MISKRTAELGMAFHWYCDDCGRLNFCLPIRPELTDDEREDIYRQMHNLEAYESLPEHWEQFHTCCIPDTVQCDECGTWFDAIDDESP